MIDKYIERFHTKYEIVTESGCWLWTDALSHGYAQYRVNGKTVRGHRYSYQIHKGELSAGMIVMHSCDTPSCVNPDHLSLGTQQDNMNDMVSKKRQATGASHYKTKLTEEQVLDIRTKRLKAIEFAELYNIGNSNVVLIQQRRRWKSI